MLVERETSALGLEPGILELGKNGEIILKNAGNIATTIAPDGSILVKRGDDILMHLLPE